MRYVIYHKMSSEYVRCRRNHILLFACGSVCLWITFNVFANSDSKIELYAIKSHPEYASYSSAVDGYSDATITNLNVSKTNSSPPKQILLWTKFYGKSWQMEEGFKPFKRLGCKYANCLLTTDRRQLLSSDAVIVNMRDISNIRDLPHERLPHQRWVFYLLESPFHVQLNLTVFNGLFNWTSTYTSDSDVPCAYGRFINGTMSRTSHLPSSRKSRMVAWFVTNCKTDNRREDYIDALR